MLESITLTLAGHDDEALIVHNGLLADREYEWARRLAEVTSKRKKTDEDHAAVAFLEWNGSLYFDDEMGPYLPGDNVRRCLLDAARLSKEGKNVERGVLNVSRKNRLNYDGPRTRESLWDDHRFQHRAIVKVGQSKIVRTRPKFVRWSATVTVDFDSSVIEGRDITRIANVGGRAIGLCDGRPFYGGRFDVESSA